MDDDADMDHSDDEAGKINKLDLDQAFELYLTKRPEIAKSHALIYGGVDNSSLLSNNNEI